MFRPGLNGSEEVVRSNSTKGLSIKRVEELLLMTLPRPRATSALPQLGGERTQVGKPLDEYTP